MRSAALGDRGAREAQRIPVPEGGHLMLTGPQKRTHEHELLVDDPWCRRLVEQGRARWVVVDDLVDDDRCELAISPWPRLTDDGLLTFAKSEEEHIVALADARWFHDLVRRARRLQFQDANLPEEVLDRPLRVGDTFAAWITVSGADEGSAPPGGHRCGVSVEHDEEGIADVTDHARVFGKVQVAVAEAAPVDVELLPDLVDEADEA
jgi:hypothetical protein